VHNEMITNGKIEGSLHKNLSMLRKYSTLSKSNKAYQKIKFPTFLLYFVSLKIKKHKYIVNAQLFKYCTRPDWGSGMWCPSVILIL